MRSENLYKAVTKLELKLVLPVLESNEFVPMLVPFEPDFTRFRNTLSTMLVNQRLIPNL